MATRQQSFMKEILSWGCAGRTHSPGAAVTDLTAPRHSRGKSLPGPTNLFRYSTSACESYPIEHATGWGWRDGSLVKGTCCS